MEAGALNVKIDVADFEKISALFQGSARRHSASSNALSVVILNVQDILPKLAA